MPTPADLVSRFVQVATGVMHEQASCMNRHPTCQAPSVGLPDTGQGLGPSDCSDQVKAMLGCSVLPSRTQRPAPALEHARYSRVVLGLRYASVQPRLSLACEASALSTSAGPATGTPSRSGASRSHDTDVVVIGAGIGGLSCAALLAKYGVACTVVESHTIPGGAAHVRSSARQ